MAYAARGTNARNDDGERPLCTIAILRKQQVLGELSPSLAVTAAGPVCWRDYCR